MKAPKGKTWKGDVGYLGIDLDIERRPEKTRYLEGFSGELSLGLELH